MFTKNRILSFCLIFTFWNFAKAAVIGESVTFTSPNKLVEQCVKVAHIPGGEYSKKDEKKEKEYCAIDFYSKTTAICPKTVSTSPGTYIHEIKDGMTQAAYESSQCSVDHHNKLGKLKVSMNQQGTSGTFSTSSLLYYHFSRYFDTSVDVPVAVYRTMDKDEHYKRVSSKVGTQRNSQMQAGWETLRAAELDPTTYNPMDDLFTVDLKQIYGVILKAGGERYDAEINGARQRGWGKEQNVEFQETPAFYALRSESSLDRAIVEGEALARHNSKINHALDDEPIEPLQMIYWMKELSEIALLDFIFSQQDRVGNIDYHWYWYWIENGKVEKEKVDSKLPRIRMDEIKPPAEAAPFHPILLQRTIIGDNDAGGLVRYADFAKITQMLEGLRHFNADTYRLLVNLNKDFQAQGPLYKYLASHFGLRAAEIKQTVANTALATSILQRTCQASPPHKLQFDLQPKRFFRTGQVQPVAVDCVNP